MIKAVANAVGVRLMLGINFAAGSPRLAAAEARAMVSVIGARRISAFELGNEPELYGNPAFPWYYLYQGKPVPICPSKVGCQPVPARQNPYDLTAFINDFARYGKRLPRVPLAGPASNGGSWLGSGLSQFISAEPRLGVVTMHRYPFQACFVDPSTAHYPTIARMLSPYASIGQAQGAAPFAATAHAHHLSYAIDEINTISCGNPPGLTNSFAMALWALDTLFAHAQAGVDSLNIHTWPGAIYRLFTFCDWPRTPIHCRPFDRPRPGWQAIVEPEYYGLMMFARAAPHGSRLLQTSSTNQAVRAWATRAPDGSVRVVLINGDPTKPHHLSVRVTGSPVQATLERLQAPSASATTGVTLGGQSFGAQTHTGLLAGQSTDSAISPTGGAYSVLMPAASAAMLTLR
ncbi:MAG TPA: glycosyl hydrolase family 79 C-terminal domain-containing protein [Solirubrobacteraceae bacterium]